MMSLPHNFNRLSNLEKLKILREKGYRDVVEERSNIFYEIFRLFKNWKVQLPDLRNIFQPEEIERLLFDSKILSNGDWVVIAQVIGFVARTGYRHEPTVDIDGKTLSLRATPLHCFNRWTPYRIIHDLLTIYSKFYVNYQDDSGLTHLHLACTASDCRDFVKKFLELGQDPNLVVEETGDSPLHFAARGLNTLVVELLLRRGADPNLANNDGSTPLHSMVGSYNNAYCPMKVFFEINDYLERTVHINARDNLDNTPLHLTIKCVRRLGIMNTVELLLRRGIDPNLANAEGSTALHLICKRGDNYDTYSSNRYCEDDIVERYFKMIDDQNQTLQVDARDGLGRTPLQLAVASLEPKAVDVLFDRGADLSNFVFPDGSYFGEKLKVRHSESWFKFRRASSALAVVERLENKGYELDRSDALTIMEFFAKHELFDKSVDLEKCWYDDEVFVRRAKQWNIRPNLSFYDLVQLRPKEAAKRFTCTDYYNIWYAEQFWKRPHNEDCDSYLCEKLSKRFFRCWTLESFVVLIYYRLPIECCELIIEQLENKDLYNICLAVADQSHDVSN